MIYALVGRVPFLVWLALALAAWGWWGAHTSNALRLEKAQAQAVAQAEARAEEQRRQAVLVGVVHEQAAMRARDAAAAARAGATAQRLQLMVDEMVKRGGAPGNPVAAAECEAARASRDVLADLFRRADEHAGILAGAADAARTAGIECQRRYDALTPAKEKGP